MRHMLLVCVLGLAACGPMSPERANEICSERARKAAGPTGEVGIGVNSERGLISKVDIEISSDFIAGRDPDAVYAGCMRSLTGQPVPARAVASLPGVRSR